MKVELVYLKQCNAIWLNRENLALGASDWYHVVVGTDGDATQVQSTAEVCRRVGN